MWANCMWFSLQRACSGSDSIWKQSCENGLYQGETIMPFLCILSGNLKRLKCFLKYTEALAFGFALFYPLKISENENSRDWINLFNYDNILYLLCNMKIITELNYFKLAQTFLSQSNRILSSQNKGELIFLLGCRPWKCHAPTSS